MAVVASVSNLVAFAASARAAAGAAELDLAASFAELLQDELAQPGAPVPAHPPPRADAAPPGATMAWIVPVSLLDTLPDRGDARKKRLPTSKDRRPPHRRNEGEDA